MTRPRGALIGVHTCGCITAYIDTEASTKTEIRDFYRTSADVGREVRHMTAEDRESPNFMVWECPHDPKGWEPKPQ